MEQTTQPSWSKSRACGSLRLSLPLAPVRAELTADISFGYGECRHMQTHHVIRWAATNAELVLDIGDNELIASSIAWASKIRANRTGSIKVHAEKSVQRNWTVKASSKASLARLSTDLTGQFESASALANSSNRQNQSEESLETSTWYVRFIGTPETPVWSFQAPTLSSDPNSDVGPYLVGIVAEKKLGELDMKNREATITGTLACRPDDIIPIECSSILDKIPLIKERLMRARIVKSMRPYGGLRVILSEIQIGSEE